jgi:photosystem II stability/assembly factor-like uncharacterized protein
MRRGRAFGLAVLAIVVLAGLAPSWVARDANVRAQTPAQMSEQAGAAYDAAFFSALKWRSVGPARGGRSIAVAGHADRPLEYYFGATGGGLWKTVNGGTTWSAVSDKFFKTSSVGAVAVAPSNPDVVYAGMGEVQLRGNIIQGDGIYKSSDAGKTWAHAGLEKTMAIGRIRVHPKNPDMVWVAALGNPYTPNPERGIFRSKDGGKTWDRTLFRDEKSGGVDLALDPGNPDVLYASLWEVYRTPHSLSSGGPGSGLFKSTDGGSTWTELTRKPGLPTGVVGKIGVSVSGADSNRVYAIVEAAEGGVFLSDDGGESWKSVNNERRLRQRAFYYTRIYADPKAKDTVYVLNTAFYRSTDAGKTYRRIRVPHGDNHDLWIAPNDPKRMINSNDGGGNVSFDGGQTWTDQDYPTAQFYNVFTTAHQPYHICGAQQDNSTACVPSAASGGGGGGSSSIPTPLYSAGGGESGYIAPHPTNPNIFYAGSYGGLLTRLDRATGTANAVNVWPENPMGHSAKDIRERFQWTFPIVFSPHDPRVLYTASQHLWMTTDEGQSWTRISPDLTRADPATLGPSGGPITLDQTGVETYATIFTVAPSKVEEGLIWTGSDDGVVHVTRDGGKNWSKVTPKALPEFTRISLIEASPHKAGTAYLAGNRYQRGDRSPYIFRTDDYGQTWTQIVNGIPADDFPRVIREDTARAGLLYAGTEHGIYVSFDNGARWQSLRLDLPVTPVHGIVVQDNNLVIGTHGRSFYVLDNISVLRQLTPELTTAKVHLFTPPPARRRVQSSAPIDYFLKAPAEKVTIEVLDSSGKVLRTFEGVPEKKEKKEGEAEPPDPEERPFGGPPARVSTTAGMNRFQWDMRQASAMDFKGIIMWAGSVRGPLVLPGTYQVRLTANGESKTSALVVEKDPRLLAVTDADLQAQYTLATQVHGRLNDANQAVVRMRHLKDQAKARAEKANDAGLTSAVDAFTKKLTDIEGEVYQFRNQSNQDPLNYPIKLNNKLAALMNVVESGEGRPTKQSYEVFKELSGRLDTQLQAFDRVVKTDLPALNKTLAARKLEPIKDELPKPAPTPTPTSSEQPSQRVW